MKTKLRVLGMVSILMLAIVGLMGCDAFYGAEAFVGDWQARVKDGEVYSTISYSFKADSTYVYKIDYDNPKAEDIVRNGKYQVKKGTTVINFWDENGSFIMSQEFKTGSGALTLTEITGTTSNLTNSITYRPIPKFEAAE